MRYPKIIDKLNGGIITIIQLVLTIHNSIVFVKEYVRINVILVLNFLWGIYEDLRSYMLFPSK